MSLPDFYIIGAMKCATSSIHDQLANIKGFHLSEPKEPNFFSDDEQYSLGLGWYLDLFKCPDGSITGESSTHYSKFPTYKKTISRMKVAGVSHPNIIYVIRDPIDRLVSQYIHEWSENTITCDINKAIYKYPRLIDYSRYDFQIEHYLTGFKNMRFQVVFFEALRDRSDLLLQSICQFLNYEEKVKWDQSIEASNVSAKRIRKFPLYNILVDSKIMEKVRRNFIPKIMREQVKRKLTMTSRPTLSEDSEAYLREIFDDDLSSLGARMGVSLNTSSYKDSIKSGLTSAVLKD